jgi:hypothetical protein
MTTSFQGSMFMDQKFPSPTQRQSYFSAKCICLIDMGHAFIVVPQGDDLKPFQRSLFRLERVRSEIMLVKDVPPLTKAECKVFLESILDALKCCNVVSTQTPFFHPKEVQKGLGKFRPCIELYGENANTPPLYIPMYLGDPKLQILEGDSTVFLQTLSDLMPCHAPDALIDCSKVFSFPEEFDKPGTWFHRMPTWKHWLADAEGEDTPSNHVRLANPLALRQQIVDKLVSLLVGNPHMGYVDRTIQLDLNTYVDGWIEKNGEFCNFSVVYGGPPRMVGGAGRM